MKLMSHGIDESQRGVTGLQGSHGGSKPSTVAFGVSDHLCDLPQ